MWRARRGPGRGVGAGDGGAHGAVADLCGAGDLAVGQSEPRRAGHGLLVVGVGVALSLGGALDAAQDL
jgi:hypothetical protein